MIGAFPYQVELPLHMCAHKVYLSHPAIRPFFYLFDIYDDVGEMGLGIFPVFWGQNFWGSNIITGARKKIGLAKPNKKLFRVFWEVMQRGWTQPTFFFAVFVPSTPLFGVCFGQFPV